ncbi:Regulator of chromosome condensation [Gryllus bimaculatus]|nr:Regulator of chromosome condensation [Gryllus bimaculatus]
MPVKKGVKRSRAATTGGSGGKRPKLIVSSPGVTRTKEAGIVLTFGQGDVGQLGLGEDIMERMRPALVPLLKDIVDVITFGCNDEGGLGRETSEEGSEFKPGKVELVGKAIQITAGDSHSAVLLDDGRVFAWGSFRDSVGAMGLTLNGIEKSPVEILPGFTVVKIASGSDHLVMLTNEGQLFTCGCGEQGQLGRIPERGANRKARQGLTHLLKPEVVKFKPRLKPVFEDVWAGSYCTFAKERLNGQIYVFGLNNHNQLGFKNDGEQSLLYSLGRKEYGRLGLGELCPDAEAPVLIPALKDKKCVDIACGTSVSFAVTDKGEAFAWGMGTSGQLGTGDEADVYEPHLIGGKQLENRKVVQVSAGGQHTVLLATNSEGNSS